MLVIVKCSFHLFIAVVFYAFGKAMVPSIIELAWDQFMQHIFKFFVFGVIYFFNATYDLEAITFNNNNLLHSLICIHSKTFFLKNELQKKWHWYNQADCTCLYGLVWDKGSVLIAPACSALLNRTVNQSSINLARTLQYYILTTHFFPLCYLLSLSLSLSPARRSLLFHGAVQI